MISRKIVRTECFGKMIPKVGNTVKIREMNVGVKKHVRLFKKKKVR